MSENAPNKRNEAFFDQNKALCVAKYAHVRSVRCMQTPTQTPPHAQTPMHIPRGMRRQTHTKARKLARKLLCTRRTKHANDAYERCTTHMRPVHTRPYAYERCTKVAPLQCTRKQAPLKCTFRMRTPQRTQRTRKTNPAACTRTDAQNPVSQHASSAIPPPYIRTYKRPPALGALPRQSHALDDKILLTDLNKATFRHILPRCFSLFAIRFLLFASLLRKACDRRREGALLGRKYPHMWLDMFRALLYIHSGSFSPGRLPSLAFSSSYR